MELRVTFDLIQLKL